MGSEGHFVHAERVVSVSSDPRIHAKTLLLILAVNTIYFAQLVNIVGSGALTRDITSTVGGSTEGVWFTQVVAILTAVLGIPVSQAADLWGRKVFLIVLTAFGCVGAILVSRANGAGMAIAGFTITGISYGAQPLLHAITSETLARKYRPFAQASVNISAAAGAIFGLLVGGALTRNDSSNFRIYWYIVAGVYAFAAITCQLLYNPPPRRLQIELTLREKLGKLDWIGYSILTPALVLFCMSLSWSQNPYPWTDAHILAPFIIGVLLTIILIAYETLSKKDVMFHHDLFRHRNFPLALGCVFVEGVVFFCANNYFAFEVSILFSTGHFLTGAHYCIAFLAYAVSAAVTGYWSARSKAVRIPTVTAFGFFVIFNILMATVTRSTSVDQIWAYPLFLGTGLGMCLTALVTAAHFATPRDLIAITSGLLISTRSLGGSVGLAIYNAVFSSGIATNLGAKISEAVIPLGFPQSGLPQLIGSLAANDNASLMKIEGITPQIIGAAVGGLQEAYVLSFRFVWVTAGCLSLIAVIGSFFFIDPTSEFNTQVDAPIVSIDTVVNQDLEDAPDTKSGNVSQ